MTRARRRESGFFVTDVLTGLILIVALTIALGAAVNRQLRTSQRFADEREAVRSAERVMLDLQTGRSIPPDASVSVEPLENGWRRVTVRVRDRSVELYGRVPDGGRR